MGRYRLGPVYWGNDAGAYVPLAREQDKKANPELIKGISAACAFRSAVL